MLVLNSRHVDGIRLAEHLFKAVRFYEIMNAVSLQETAHILFHLKGSGRGINDFHPAEVLHEITERPHGPSSFEVPAHKDGFPVEAALVFKGLLQGENVEERLGGMLVAA